MNLRVAPSPGVARLSMATPINDWIDEPGVYRPLLRLAWPVLGEQALAMAVGFSDTILTGHYLGESHLAAVNLMAYTLWLLYGLFSVVAIGTSALVARYVGARRFTMADRFLHQSLILGLLISVPGAIAALTFGPDLVALLKLRGESAAAAVRYWNIIVPMTPCIMVIAVGIAALRGAGAMVHGLCIMAIVNIVNIAVSWACCLGWGPLPQLGWDGIALGTTCGYLVGAIGTLTILGSGMIGLRLRWRMFRPEGHLIYRLLRVGIPGGLDSFALILCQLWFVSIVNVLGDRAAAAHGVAIRIESLAFLPGAAFQVAAATMAGQYLGAKQPGKATRSVLVACLLGGLVMGLGGVVFYIGAFPLASLMLGSHHHDVAYLAAPLLRTIAFGIPPLALVMILTGALRGAGDTSWPLVFTLVGFLGVRIPVAYWLALSSVPIPWVNDPLPGLGLGVLGAWYAMVTDLYVRAILTAWRFWQGGWKEVRV
ncbi:MAG TPA: MATE family efflux transporter [Thermogutta sp.]|nr:MATE family efflux transporter [Thermogutta sp.]